MVSDVEHKVRGPLRPRFTCNTVRNFRGHSMASCCCTARGSSETYVTRVHGVRSLAMRRRMWLFERKWFDGSKTVLSKPGLLRQSVYWNKRRVDQSPRSRAESLVWVVSLVQFYFFGVPVHAANLSSRLQWRIVAIVFSLRPFYGTHGLRQTPKLQVVLLAQVPSVSKSQALCPRESNGKSYFYFICSSVDNPYAD